MIRETSGNIMRWITSNIPRFDRSGESCHEDDNSLLMTVSPLDEDDEAPGEDDARRWPGELRKGKSGELVWDIGSCLTTLEDEDISGRGRYRDGW